MSALPLGLMATKLHPAFMEMSDAEFQEFIKRYALTAQQQNDADKSHEPPLDTPPE